MSKSLFGQNLLFSEIMSKAHNIEAVNITVVYMKLESGRWVEKHREELNTFAPIAAHDKAEKHIRENDHELTYYLQKGNVIIAGIDLTKEVH